MIISVFDDNFYDYLKLGWKHKGPIDAQMYELERDPDSPIDCKRIIKTINVAWVSWECDDRVWVVEDSTGKCRLYGTDHGSVTEVSADFLKTKIEEYENLINQTIEALELYGDYADEILSI